MRIVTFDLGSHMAMANNLWGFSQVEKADFSGDRVERAKDTLVWLQTFAGPWEGGIDVVVYERPFARGRDATRCLWGLAGLIEAVFGSVCAVVDIDPSSIKKWATGNSKASKEEMIARARELGYIGDNEHEADAYLLLHYAEENVSV